MTVTLHLGDCLDILPNMSDQVDAIITDVPYGTTACKWDVIIPLDKMWEQVKRLCKGAFVTTASQPFTGVLVASNLKMFRDELIWKKSKASGHLAANKAPLNEHENICIFSSNGYTYNPQMVKGAKHDRITAKSYTSVYDHENTYDKREETDEFYPRSIVGVKNAYYTDGKQVHPTQKPVALYEYLVKTYTNEGDTVLDFCAGSGTTGVACVNTGRHFIGIEKERPYFEIMERRIKQAQEARQLELQGVE